MKISLNDLMSRYTPTVSQSRYHLSFVPVVRDTSEEGDSGVGLDGSEEDSLSALSPSHTSSNTNNSSGGGVRTRGHLMRTSRFCWCDKATRELIIKVSSGCNTHNHTQSIIHHLSKMKSMFAGC